MRKHVEKSYKQQAQGKYRETVQKDKQQHYNKQYGFNGFPGRGRTKTMGVLSPTQFITVMDDIL